IEAGLRLDWDDVVRTFQLSPRLSAAYAPKWLHETKVAAGIGIFYDAPSLGILGRQDQVSVSTFYNPSGEISRGPVETAFLVDQRNLRSPRFRIVSLSFERKLPFESYGKASYISKLGHSGFTFAPDAMATFAPIPIDGLYRLRNWRNDRYD